VMDYVYIKKACAMAFIAKNKKNWRVKSFTIVSKIKLPWRCDVWIGKSM
jgi:hypothetical protein